MKSFFLNFRRRYNLDEVLEEYEKENGKINGSKTDLDEDQVKEAEMKVNKVLKWF